MPSFINTLTKMSSGLLSLGDKTKWPNFKAKKPSFIISRNFCKVIITIHVPLQPVVCIFFTPNFTVNVTDNLYTKQGNSSIFGSNQSRVVSNQEQVIMACVRYFISIHTENSFQL